MMSSKTGASRITGETRRLFIALPLAEAVRNSVAGVQAQFQTHGWPVKWVEPELAHITLKFLGETDAALIPEIARHLDNISGGFRPIRLATSGYGAFPSLKRPQVLWLGLSGDVDSAARLAESVDGAMSLLGFDRERRAFRPHVTLGRVRRGASLPPDAGTMIEHVRAEHALQEIDRFQLVQSVLGRSGPAYTALAEWRLGSTAANRVELVEHG